MKRITLTIVAVLATVGFTLGFMPRAANATTYYNIANDSHTNLCLAEPQGAVVGSGVIVWDCTHGQGANSWFQWSSGPTGDELQNRESGLCAYNPNNSNQLTMQTCQGVAGTGNGEHFVDIYGGSDPNDMIWARDKCGDLTLVYCIMSNDGDVNANGNPVIGWHLTNLDYQVWDALQLF